MDFSRLEWLLPASDDAINRVINDKITTGSLQRIAGLRYSAKQARRLAKAAEKISDIDGIIEIKIVILTDCNLNFLTDMLVATGLRYRLKLIIQIVEYSQIIDQILNRVSPLYLFNPDFIIYANFGKLFHNAVADFSNFSLGSNAAQAVATQIRTEIDLIAGELAAHSNAQFIVQTVPKTAPVLFGNSDRKHEHAFSRQTDLVNQAILGGDWLVADIADLASRVGQYRWTDDAKYHWAKLPFTPSCSEIYCDWLLRLISLTKGRGKKCLILDLDNTLWGGVIGDDELNGILLGNNSAAGEAFLAGQRYYKMLANRGVLLAVCSKNDLNNALLPFDRHPDMVLKRDDISCFVANWNDKPSNIRAIASSLNLGLDSFVFLDDNPMERDMVRKVLPEVAVPEIPDHDASLYPRIVEAAGYFESLGLTDADLIRASDYKANIQRAEIRQSITDIQSYLRALEMHFTFGPFETVNEDRILQLINRSNQFNLTTRRYTGAEVRNFYGYPGKFGFTGRLLDKFSDSGLVTLLICEEREIHGEVAWEIDTWVMSCRVLGRKAEEVTLISLARAANAAGIEYIFGRYIPTEKNGMVADLFNRMGFVQISNFDDSENFQPGESNWKLDVAKYLRESRIEELPYTITDLSGLPKN